MSVPTIAPSNFAQPTGLPSFPAGLPGMGSPLSAYNAAGNIPQNPQDQWILQQALSRLGQLYNLPTDETYIYQLGVNPVFHSGREAVQLIQGRNIRVEFGDMGDSPAHAQWAADQNLIMINQRYRGDSSPDTVRAIAEAIYHEAGHAKDGDGISSIQEETDCLALNTMAHRFHEAQDPVYAQNSSQSRLMSDGVALYPKLFFDNDPTKQALTNRIILKYGDLPFESQNHPIAKPTQLNQYGQRPLMYLIAEKIDAKATQQGLLPPSPSLNQPIPTIPPAITALLTQPMPNLATPMAPTYPGSYPMPMPGNRFNMQG